MIFLQSVVDIAAGILGIPLFIFYLGIGRYSNCFTAALGLRATHLLLGATLTVMTSKKTFQSYILTYVYNARVRKKKLLI